MRLLAIYIITENPKERLERRLNKWMIERPERRGSQQREVKPTGSDQQKGKIDFLPLH